jgi:hypothetical protein
MRTLSQQLVMGGQVFDGFAGNHFLQHLDGVGHVPKQTCKDVEKD